MYTKWIVFAGFIFLLTNCTRTVENQKVSVVLPQNTSMKTFTPESSSVLFQSTTEAAAAFSNGSIFDVSEANCYMLMVDDPSGDFGNLKCRDTSGNEKRFLRAVSGISASGSGQTIELLLATGTKRKLYLFGINANAGSCVPPLQDPSAPQNWSRPRLLTSVEVELRGGEQRTTMQLPSGDISGKLEFANCELESGAQPIAEVEDLETSFGTGRDGDLTISTASFIDLSTTLNTVEGNPVYYSKTMSVTEVVSLDGQRVKVGTSLSANTDYLLAGDLVLFHIPAANDGMIGPDNACGAGLYRGKYSYARVVGIDTTSDLVTLDRPMLNKPLYTNTGRAFINSRLANPATDSDDFCRISMVRVPEFRNIIFAPNSSANRTIKSADFDSANFVGGILAFKVSEAVALDDSSSGGGFNAIFSMRGKGFSGNLATEGGAGIQGRSSLAFSSANGGHGATSAGGGGGSNAGRGNDGDGGTMAGDTVGPAVGGAGGVVIPARDRKLFHGGQGGGVTGYAGHPGGGIVLAQINHINLNVTTSGNSLQLQFDVAGLSTSGDGAGAGAGGTVFTNVKHVENNKYGQNEIKLFADGGQNTNGGTQGGAGGPGMVELQYCNASDVIDLIVGNPTLIESANLGSFGGTGGELVPNGAPSDFQGAGGFTIDTGSAPPSYCFN